MSQHCEAIVKKTGKRCENLAKEDGLCGIHLNASNIIRINKGSKAIKKSAGKKTAYIHPLKRQFEEDMPSGQNNDITVLPQAAGGAVAVARGDARAIAGGGAAVVAGGGATAATSSIPLNKSNTLLFESFDHSSISPPERNVSPLRLRYKSCEPPKRNVLSCLYNEKYNVEKNSLSLLMMAKNKDKVIDMLDDGADPNFMTSDGETALSYFAGQNIINEDETIDILEILIKHGANVNKRINGGRAAIHYSGNNRIAMFLIKNGAISYVPENDDIIKDIAIEDNIMLISFITGLSGIEVYERYFN